MEKHCKYKAQYIPKAANYIERDKNICEGCFCKQVKEYGESTSVHGIKYICENGRHFCER